MSTIGLVLNVIIVNAIFLKLAKVRTLYICHSEDYVIVTCSSC